MNAYNQVTPGNTQRINAFAFDALYKKELKQDYELLGDEMWALVVVRVGDEARGACSAAAERPCATHTEYATHVKDRAEEDAAEAPSRILPRGHEN